MSFFVINYCAIDLLFFHQQKKKLSKNKYLFFKLVERVNTIIMLRYVKVIYTSFVTKLVQQNVYIEYVDAHFFSLEHESCYSLVYSYIKHYDLTTESK